MNGNQTRITIFFLGGLLALTFIGIWIFSSIEQDDGTIPAQGKTTAQTSDPEEPVTEADSPFLKREPLVPESPPPTNETESIRTVFSGIVIDTTTDNPVTTFSVWLRQLKKSNGSHLQPYPPWQKEPIESSEGRFSIPLEEGGTYIIRYSANGYQRPDHFELEIPEGEGITGYVLQLTPGLTISGRVVEDATGRPLAGAEVVPYLIRSFSRHGDTMRPEVWADGKPVESASDGTFTVTDLRAGPHRLWARHPDFAEAHADEEAGGEGVEIRLGTGPRFYGEVRDTLGKPTPEVKVNYYSALISAVQSVSTGSDGRYTTPPLPPGSYSLSTTETEAGSSPAGTVLREMKMCELLDDDVEVNFGLQESQVIWRGTLFDGDGITVPNAKITLLRRHDSRDRGERKQPGTAICRSKTDANGDFEIGPLDLWGYDIDVQFAENTLISATNRVDRIEFEEPGLIVRDIHLRRTELSGFVIEERTGKPWRNSRGWVMAATGRGKIFTTSVDGEGRFRFRSIEPGTYFLSANGPDVAQGRLENVVLGKNSVIDDLRIVLPFSGTLDLKVTGLDEIRNQNLSIKIESTDNDQGWTISGAGCIVDHTGTCTLTTSFEAGSWKITVSHASVGRVEQSFTIRAGEKTEVEIDRDAFLPF